jgi:diadenosine tetraphosphatase ApaH/serine/threonine PP2A family protein phosphatase
VYDQRAAKASLDAALQHGPEVRYVFGGHVHMQTLYYRGSGDGLMPFKPQPGRGHSGAPAPPVAGHRGSVGQPRDGNTQAMYCPVDTDRAQLTFHRVAYDHHASRQRHSPRGLARLFCRPTGGRAMKLLEPGAELDGFTIEECIHSGGMAHIYRVRYADGQRTPVLPWP